MKIDTAGNYTLRYTATDECGNETVIDRSLVVAAPRTVLYADNTLIINEAPTDRSRNEHLHGSVARIYPYFKNNITPGEVGVDNYIFSNASIRPWNNQASSIERVEIGMPISPKKTNYWFKDFYNCTSMDLSKLDTSMTTEMVEMFNGCNFATVDLSNFNTQNVITMYGLFYSCMQLSSIDLSSFSTPLVTDMQQMFGFCQSLSTILVSDTFDVSQVTVSSGMFSAMSANLVGGSGTVWSNNNPKDKTYARIDNPPDEPGYFTLKAS